MRSSVAVRLRTLFAPLLVMLLACAMAPTIALADEAEEGAGSKVGISVDGPEEGSTEDASPLVGALTKSRTYVMVADTLSDFSVVTIASGTVELASDAGEEMNVPTISSTYIAQGCVYSFDEEEKTFSLVNAANAEVSEEGLFIVPSALELEGAAYPVTGVSAGAFSGSDALLVALSRNVVFVDDDAFTGAGTLRGVYVSSANDSYSSYDGCLYDRPQKSLLLVPEGKLGAVRIPSGAENIGSEAFSHCASVDSISVDAGSAAISSLEDVEIHNANGDPIEVVVMEGSSLNDGVPSDRNASDEAPLLSEDDGFGGEVSDDMVESNNLTESIDLELDSGMVDNCVVILQVATNGEPSDTALVDRGSQGAPILTETVPLSDERLSARSDSSIFHMELLGDGSGFRLAYIEASASGAVAIPALWTQDGRTLPVVSIGSWALCGGFREGDHANNVTSIHIPATITSIGGEYPFGWGSQRQLASITVDPGNSVYASLEGVLFTKDMEALIFYPVKKTDEHYRIPASVQSVYGAAFTRCYDLRAVTIPAALSQRLGDRVLLDACSNVRDLYVADSTNPSMTNRVCIMMDNSLITVHLAVFTADQVSIWSNAGFPVENIVQGEPRFTFVRNDGGTGFILTAVSSLVVGDVDVPATWTQDGVTLPVVGIGSYAFASGHEAGAQAVGVTSVHIPASVVWISPAHPFGWCDAMSMASVTVDPENPSFTALDGILYDKSVTELVFYPFAKRDKSYAMPSTLTNYRYSSMTRCRYLESVTFSASFMGSLGHDALMDACSTVRDVYIDGVTPSGMQGHWFLFANKAEVTIHLLNYVDAEIQTWVNAGFSLSKIVPMGSALSFAESADGGGYVLVGIDSSVSGVVVVPSQWSQNGRTLPVVGIGGDTLGCGWTSSPAANVTSIQIPASLTYISSDYPFGWTPGRKLFEIKVDRENPAFCSVDGVLFSKDKSQLIFYPPGRTNRSYSIPAGTTISGYQPFVRCSYLQSIVFPVSYAASLSNAGHFDSNSYLTDIYVEGATSSALGPNHVNNTDKSKYWIHLANYTAEEVQLWVNAGFQRDHIVPSAGTASFSVTFDVAGGDPQPSDQVVLRDGHVREPADPTRPGYDFKGWYSFKQDKIWDFDTNAIDSDMTLIAVWEPHKTTLRLYLGDRAELADVEGAPEVESDDVGRYVEYVIPYDQTFTLPLIGRKGHKLIEWHDSEGVAVKDMNGDTLINGGKVRNLSRDDGAFFAYTPVWRAVYSVEVPVSIDLTIHADFLHGDIEVSAASAGSSAGAFLNYSEGAVEIVSIADESDGAGAKALFPHGGYERSFLTVSSGAETDKVSIALGKGTVIGKGDEGWAWTPVVPSGSSSDGFVDGASESTVPGKLEVVYGVDVTTLKPQDMALVADDTELARLMYTVQFANPQ